MRTFYTVGHSTHAINEFVEILKAHGIGALADVRRFPGSRRHPHFNAAALKTELPKSGIDYIPFTELGGRRPPRIDSPNTAWRNAAFRGYADYMLTPEFLAGLHRLEESAKKKTVAIMCAEALPWQCHRSLIADALRVRGWNVMDIFNAKSAKPHELPEFATVNGKEIVYAQAPGLFEIEIKTTRKKKSE